MRLRVRGINETVRNLEELQKLVNAEAGKILVLAATKFQTKAQLNEKAVDTGTLRRSIHLAAPDAEHDSDLEKAHKEAPNDTEPIKASKIIAKTEKGFRVYIGTWLQYAKKIHRDGGKNGKGKYFLKNAYKTERQNVIDFYSREIEKLTKLVGKWKVTQSYGNKR